MPALAVASHTVQGMRSRCLNLPRAHRYTTPVSGALQPYFEAKTRVAKENWRRTTRIRMARSAPSKPSCLHPCEHAEPEFLPHKTSHLPNSSQEVRSSNCHARLRRQRGPGRMPRQCPPTSPGAAWRRWCPLKRLAQPAHRMRQ